MEHEGEKQILKKGLLIDCVLEGLISSIFLEEKSNGSHIFIKKYSQGSNTFKQNLNINWKYKYGNFQSLRIKPVYVKASIL